MELHAAVHQEKSDYWAEVKELPGCFASGKTLDELTESLREAVHFYLEDDSDMSKEENTLLIEGITVQV